MSSFLQKYRPQLRFFGKLLAVYAVWYVAYDLWLLPDGRVDAWLSQHVAAVSGHLLRALGFDAAVQGRIVWLPGSPGVEIADGCNGLTTLGLFAGFVLAYPGRWTRRLLFLPLGLFAIYLVNIGRVTALALLQRWPDAFDVLHTFGGTTVFYVAVFALWMVWAHWGGAPARPRRPVLQPATPSRA